MSLIEQLYSPVTLSSSLPRGTRTNLFALSFSRRDASQDKHQWYAFPAYNAYV
jgi:hypothetical protein